jgi:D-lactate dehydrogenase
MQTTPVTASRSPFLGALASIIGATKVVTAPSKMRRFTSGFRFGSGMATCVLLPGTLLELWRVLEVCVANRKIVICQAANTGLTGGSTPFGDNYDRDVVVINMMRIKALHLLDGGKQVVAFPGTTLDELERALDLVGREPHSVIGSSCLGASVIGGICNNSGGSLIHRGPAFTELALYARVDDDGSLELVNHLDIELGCEPVAILQALDQQSYGPQGIQREPKRQASDGEYKNHLRDIGADTPARFNADPRRLFEASGSAGRIIVFAVRLDTFEKEQNTKVFYLGTNDPDELTRLRRSMLASEIPLPIAAEYMHRDAFNIAEIYGKDTFLFIRTFGTRRLPPFFAAKRWVDAFAERFRLLPTGLSDRVLQFASFFIPSHLPRRMRDYRNRFEHHLMLKVAGDAIGLTRQFLVARFPSTSGDMMECSAKEGAAAFLHRFAAAGAAVRYQAVNGPATGGIVALDIALPRNALEWTEQLPEALEQVMLHKLYYGHFFCYVFHQDYIIRKGINWLAIERAILKLVDERRARYPAEHNVGHLYHANEVVEAHYRSLDPCNCFNPGIGQTSKRLRWN